MKAKWNAEKPGSSCKTAHLPLQTLTVYAFLCHWSHLRDWDGTDHIYPWPVWTWYSTKEEPTTFSASLSAALFSQSLWERIVQICSLKPCPQTATANRSATLSTQSPLGPQILLHAQSFPRLPTSQSTRHYQPQFDSPSAPVKISQPLQTRIPN